MAEEEEEVQAYRVKCLNNLAAAQLKLEQYSEALHSSRDVLCLDPNNVKALFRSGKVRTEPLLFVNHTFIDTAHLVFLCKLQCKVLDGGKQRSNYEA